MTNIHIDNHTYTHSRVKIEKQIYSLGVVPFLLLISFEHSHEE